MDSIPSSAGREDHVSMGSIGARKLGQVIANVRASLAIELITAAAGVDQRKPLKASTGVLAALGAVREVVGEMVEDRPLYVDIAAAGRLIERRALIEAVQGAVGSCVRKLHPRWRGGSTRCRWWPARWPSATRGPGCRRRPASR